MFSLQEMNGPISPFAIEKSFANIFIIIQAINLKFG